VQAARPRRSVQPVSTSTTSRRRPGVASGDDAFLSMSVSWGHAGYRTAQGHLAGPGG
jgi:hypothetical protein